MPDSYRIAVIPGDGIGKEVVPEGVKILDAVASLFNINIDWQWFDWSCEWYLQGGSMMRDDGIGQLREFDSVFLGAVALPTGRGHISVWSL